MINKKLGFYTVGEQMFDSKIKAYLYSKETNQPVNWYFNDHEFYAYDWTVEPELTLDQLYDRRCRELRETYDYLILSYSGGADSHNILTSFVRQGLHIDEIVVNTMEKGNKRRTVVDANNKDAKNAHAEHDLQTLPRLREIQPHIPNTKITITDLSDYLFEYLEKAGDASWIMDKREGLNPAGMTRFNYLHFSEVRKQFDKNKRFGLIMGLDKPRTVIHKDKFYIRFNDRTTNMQTIAEHFKEYPNSTIEFFYWAPESLDILCKQAHTIKKYLEAFPQYRHYWDSAHLDFNIQRLVHERMLRTILYTTWDDSWYQADKSTSDWYSEFDSWFLEEHQGTKAVEIWKEGIQYVTEQLGEHVKFDKSGKADGLKLIARSHFVGDMKPSIILT
jgi:hypothetical protein